jgi:ABC-type nitrate/sulfonate/bicarbonate transport system permease component
VTRSRARTTTNPDATLAPNTGFALNVVVERAGHRPRRIRRALLPPLSVIVAVFILWQLAVTLLHVNATILPGPRLIAASTWNDRANIWPAIATTSEESVLGLLLAVIVAVITGITIDWSRALRRSAYPIIVASQTLPIIALAPLVVIYFGFGLLPKIVLVGLFSFFPITVGLVQGLGSADVDAVNLLRTMRATKWQLLVRVRLPGALPQLFTGLKISVTYAFSAAIVAEYVGATQGLGVYINASSQAAPRRTDLVFGATLVTALLTVALFVVVGLIERLAMPWRSPDKT